ncbi:histidine phosphatase family protein [Winogradskyella eckloniae]|uniref:SixA phosphatase family protein n=1 Tax=Winogradskyella eckloniae TaxID=1089306 RepID=UPI001563681C|nr:histidine phosphatase family protein [Winogradskyella eckloniae]NRD21445.1 histidine phosphatase family protein [Winogradskyella eckloniae]
MKSITFMRHGKSSWKHDVIDYERPLQSRGENDAKLVANELVRLGYETEKIFSSPAKRALSTCEIVVKTLNIAKEEISIIEDLYDFDGRNVIEFIKNVSDTLNNIMIFGHNHAFTSISNIFGDRFIDNLPTSGLITIKFNIDSWQDLKKGTTELIIIPKELRND